MQKVRTDTHLCFYSSVKDLRDGFCVGLSRRQIFSGNVLYTVISSTPIPSVTMLTAGLYSALYVHVAHVVIGSWHPTRDSYSTLSRPSLKSLHHLKTAIYEVLSFSNTGQSCPTSPNPISSVLRNLMASGSLHFALVPSHSTASHWGRDVARTNASGRLTLGPSWMSRPHRWACAVTARYSHVGKKNVPHTFYTSAKFVGINKVKRGKLLNDVLFFPVFPTFFCGFISILFDLQNAEHVRRLLTVSIRRNFVTVLNLIFGTFA